MVSLEEQLSELEVSEGERKQARQYHGNLVGTLSYLLDAYELAEQVDQLDGRTDDLHRFLFEHTKFTEDRYQFRVCRLGGSAVEYTSDKMRALESSSQIRDTLQQSGFPELSSEELVRSTKGLSDDQIPDEELERRLRIFDEVLDELIVGDVLQRFAEEFEFDSNKLLNYAYRWIANSNEEYESRLAEEDLIDEQGGTPALPQIIGLAMLLCVGSIHILRGFGYLWPDSENVDEVLTGVAVIGGALLGAPWLV